MRYKLLLIVLMASPFASSAQQNVTLIKQGNNKVDILIGNKYFTSFLYSDTLEKPVLYPVVAANGATVTRGFPVKPKPGEPTDHPHHLGIWFNYENLNGLDFWNNSYAIPKEKKSQYGWVKTNKITELTNGKSGKLAYQANWTDQQNNVIVEETTLLTFRGNTKQRIIDRVTVLKAVKDATFNDAKDGMLGMRMAHELQIAEAKDQKFTDDKGNVTIIKGGSDKIANGTYITSEGKQGNDAWSTRGRWCKAYAKIGADSISISIIDHPQNPNYPTFWHARGYGLFAANPLGEKVFTNGKSQKNLHLSPGQSVTFKYRIIINSGKNTTSAKMLNNSADAFAKI